MGDLKDEVEKILKSCWNAARSTRIDTGVLRYNTFEDWYNTRIHNNTVELLNWEDLGKEHDNSGFIFGIHFIGNVYKGSPNTLWFRTENERSRYIHENGLCLENK